jgi:hypothetical protein
LLNALVQIANKMGFKKQTKNEIVLLSVSAPTATRQLLDNHVPAVKNPHATTEELLGAVFSEVRVVSNSIRYSVCSERKVGECVEGGGRRGPVVVTPVQREE